MKISLNLLLVAALFAATAVSAAEGKPPRSQPIQMEADNVTIDDQKKVSVYSGNVRLSQGDIKISADKISVFADKQRVQRLVAEGNPVTIVQARPAGDMRGSATRMEYRVPEQSVLLTGNAELWQGANQFTSARIEVSLKEGLLKAAAEKKGQDRVRVVIQPETIDEKSGKGDAKP